MRIDGITLSARIGTPIRPDEGLLHDKAIESASWNV